MVERMGTNTPVSLLSVPQYPALGFYLLNLTENQEGKGTQVIRHKVQPAGEEKTVMNGREDSGASSAQEV